MRHVSALHSARSWIAPIWAPVACTATSEPTARCDQYQTVGRAPTGAELTVLSLIER